MIIAFSVYQGTYSISASWFESRNFAEWKKYKLISETTAKNLVLSIKGLNNHKAVEVLEEYDPEYQASIVLIDSEGLLIFSDLYDFVFFDDNKISYSIPYITLPVELAGGQGFLVYQSLPVDSGLFLSSDFILSIFSILIFFLVFLLQSRKIIRDINYIDNCVDQITSGNLNIRVKQSGNDELGHLGENIEIMRRSIKRMIKETVRNEQRNLQLISGISHDLKTPLTSLIGYLDILKNPRTIITSVPEQEMYIERCYNQSQRLKKLVSNLFTYVKYTDNSLKLSKTVFPFQDLLEQALEEHSTNILERGINLEVQTYIIDSNIYGDPDHLGRVLHNLFDNLTLYTDGDMDAELFLYNDPDNIVLELSNTANSLENYNPEMLFERMVRGDESRSQSEGSGLGLSICKEIVKLHQGAINAEIINNRFIVKLLLPAVS